MSTRERSPDEIALADVGQQLETYIPPRYAESWDNVGWMVRPPETPLRGLVICVDVSREVLRIARERDLNLILSHHPLIFEPLHRLLDEDPGHRLIMEAVRHDIGVYSVHTNADSMPGGLNDLFAGRLGLVDTTPLDPLEEDPDAGLGRLGRLDPPRTLGEIEEQLADDLDLQYRQSLGEPDRSIRHVAVCTGSGADFIDEDLAAAADLYITGDVGHHRAMRARQLGLSLIMLDHYEMETVFLPFAETVWREQFGDQVPVVNHHRENPYRYYV